MGVSFGLNKAEPEVGIPLVRLANGHQQLHGFANHDAIVQEQPVALPAAYAITRERERMARWLTRHHIEFITLAAPRTLAAQRLHITQLSAPQRPDRGARKNPRPSAEHCHSSDVTVRRFAGAYDSAVGSLGGLNAGSTLGQCLVSRTGLGLAGAGRISGISGVGY